MNGRFRCPTTWQHSIKAPPLLGSGRRCSRVQVQVFERLLAPVSSAVELPKAEYEGQRRRYRCSYLLELVHRFWASAALRGHAAHLLKQMRNTSPDAVASADSPPMHPTVLDLHLAGPVRWRNRAKHAALTCEFPQSPRSFPRAPHLLACPGDCQKCRSENEQTSLFAY